MRKGIMFLLVFAMLINLYSFHTLWQKQGYALRSERQQISQEYVQRFHEIEQQIALIDCRILAEKLDGSGRIVLPVYRICGEQRTVQA